MATISLICGAECGANAATGHLQSGGTGASFSTTTVRSGLRSFRVNPAGTTCWWTLTWVSGIGSPHVARFYIRFASLPTTNTMLFTYEGDTSARQYGLAFKSSDSKLYPADRNGATITFGATGAAVTTGVWYRIDHKFVNNANPHTIDIQVDGAALTQHTVAVASENWSDIALGNFNDAETYDAFYDDLAFSDTLADYPLGAGYVLSYVPNVDGTHTSTGTNIVKGTIATPVGAAITSATTDAFNWVNARPILGGATDNTRLINQQTLLATQYVEVGFEDSVESAAPRAVEVLTADRQAATTSGGFSVKLNDNGTEDVVITRSGAGVVTDRFARKAYATMVGGGAWTLARFNALKVRFGYSGDATPDQYWRGGIIEAEYAGAVVTTHNAAAVLAGIATLGLVAKMVLPIQLGMTGIATLALLGKVTRPLAAAWTGTGTLLATLSVFKEAQIVLAGVGSLAARASLFIGLRTSMAGTGTLASSLTVLRSAAAALSSVGTFTASARVLAATQASLVGVATTMFNATMDLAEPVIELGVNWYKAGKRWTARRARTGPRDT